MISKEHLMNLTERQKEINKLQAAWNNEFDKYYKELFQKAMEILHWKDRYLECNYLQYTCRGHIHELRSQCIVVKLYDRDADMPNKYINISFDELYSEDWKKKALQKHKEQKLRKAEEEIRAEQEKERAEYERLKAKFEKTY